MYFIIMLQDEDEEYVFEVKPQSEVQVNDTKRTKMNTQ